MEQQTIEKALQNRQRFATISERIDQAEAVLAMVTAEPIGSAFEIRPAYASPKVVTVPRAILAMAMRSLILEKEDILEHIEAEFRAL